MRYHLRVTCLIVEDVSECSQQSWIVTGTADIRIQLLLFQMCWPLCSPWVFKSSQLPILLFSSFTVSYYKPLLLVSSVASVLFKETSYLGLLSLSVKPEYQRLCTVAPGAVLGVKSTDFLPRAHLGISLCCAVVGRAVLPHSRTPRSSFHLPCCRPDSQR